MFESYLAQFPVQGVVEFYPEQDWRKQVTDAQVPEKYGVYLIYGVKGDQRQLVYVGKSGTLLANGQWKSQGLCRRLLAKQGGKRRHVYFRERLAEKGFSHLSIHWVVTVNSDCTVLPAKAEADLLQIYFNKFGKLPPWNRSI